MSSAAKKMIWIYDHRFPATAPRSVSMHLPLNFNEFLQELRNDFNMGPNEVFELTMPNRQSVTSDSYDRLQNGSILLLYKNRTQAEEVTEERINIQPHYDTLLKSGLHEYYASEGRDPLPYTLAELVDNSLSATAKNDGVRSIQIQVLKDDTIGKPALIVLDNGCGMTSNQLHNWAIYRQSKFNRDQSGSTSEQGSYIRPDKVPRSINSDISYFGVGGKQAVFYFGEQVRMISKSERFPEVNELVLSKQEFERKRKEQMDVYDEIITKRPLAHPVNVKPDEKFLLDLIAEEAGRTSFTAVVITRLHGKIIETLVNDFDNWTTELAHIYHYYIHGLNGNNGKAAEPSDPVKKVDIEVILRFKAPKCPRRVNLRDVDRDMQTLYIQSAAAQFEFKACIADAEVEGLLRYHPFLYHEETYPQAPAAGNQEEAAGADDLKQEARGKRPIFECYWNGRLIPYTTISELPWCAESNKSEKVPFECYGRFSGILFANDRFQVTNNKLTFTDLEPKLKTALFTCIKNGQARRDIKKEFTAWLENCHKTYDKKFRFIDFIEVTSREDLTPKGPWSSFAAVEWDGKTYKKGQLVKSLRTNPHYYGTVLRFLLAGEHGNVFAAGGVVEVMLEPRGLYDQTKTIPISKIDRTAAEASIRAIIANDELKMPSTLNLSWHEGPPLTQNAILQVGCSIGPVQVHILNQAGEQMGRMPSIGQRRGNGFSVRLKLVFHDPKGDPKPYVCDAKLTKWGFWFNKIDARLTQGVGKYSLTFHSMLEDSTEFGGRDLPSTKLDFTVTEGCAERFEVSQPTTSVTVGQLFNINLEFKDGYDNLTLPPPNVEPVLDSRGLTLTIESKEYGKKMLTLMVIAKGTVGLSYDLCVTVPGLKKPSQTINISLLPGAPHCLSVTPSNDPLEVENGTKLTIDFEIQDVAGNVTAREGMIVQTMIPTLPLTVTDCSRKGFGQLVTKPIKMKPTDDAGLVEFNVPVPYIAKVTRTLRVLPSTQVSRIDIFSQVDENLVLKDGDEIRWLVGGSLERLCYKLFDEAGREVPLTPVIARLIKVTWTTNVDPEELAHGRLPDIKVPAQVQETKLCQVLYQDQNACSVSFTITPCPGEPVKLRVTLPRKSVRLGETLQGKIFLTLVDRFDNPTQTLTSTCTDLFKVEAEGLDESARTWYWEESNYSVSVTGLRFLPETLGSKEIRFTYKDFVTEAFIHVTPGVPALLKLIIQPEQPLQILNDHGIPTPFTLQVCDQLGNACTQQNMVVELRSLSPALKFSDTDTSQAVDSAGRVNFTVKRVMAPRGSHTLEFRARVNSSFILGPKVNLTVVLDPSKPASLMVEYDPSARFHAGERFPVFSLKVLSEDGGPMSKGLINLGDVSMWIWSGISPSPPDTAIEMNCVEYSNQDGFCFRNKEIPEHSGRHTIQFTLQNEKAKLIGEQIPIDVLPNLPFQLGSTSQIRTPVVSNITERTLVHSLILKIMDCYGNPTGQDLKGRVTVVIKSCGSASRENIPELDSNTSTFALSNGSVSIPRLAIKQHSRGDNATEYSLVFKPEVSNVFLKEFQLKFHFYNDEDHQRKMADLSKKRDELTVWINNQKEHLSDLDQLTEALNSSLKTSVCREAICRSEVTRRRMPQTTSIPRVVSLLEEKKAEERRLWNAPRRPCSIPNRFTGEQDVLGTVGHLAFVQDDDAARVISWHISGDLDCVITLTTAAGKKIYDLTNGEQQVMSLDSVFVSQGKRPLPHIRNGSPIFPAQGNPVHARELLIYQKDARSCELTFRNILGDTILMDDLDSALHYRREVVQRKMPCPTILTRKGDRVSGRGKFGGRQNRAPTSDFPMFGAPPPREHQVLLEDIDALSKYQEALEKKEEAQKEQERHMEKMNSAEMASLRKEVEEKRRQVEEISRQLASTRNQPAKRSSLVVGEPLGVSGKRPRPTT
ncbi:structural maintenance of chromosomes flexible hinge domain-containing protein 1 isoform X1 [Synchiropus splendidus]|uniref:structural maintenance of chromosomes flexible hinge domain-containing protein 1 isoform X1 n=1 Tax=Synchiropus splendidus TaxID=270530 RepID=UPI00237DD663|nr:structural maintenance of chromosomes flexible hinge domain-containing protein 1 isoform X1 [Synchiropus splendidus]